MVEFSRWELFERGRRAERKRELCKKHWEVEYMNAHVFYQIIFRVEYHDCKMNKRSREKHIVIYIATRVFSSSCIVGFMRDI